ncbi:sulfurtransferase [Leptolyngbya sp. 7M]|uniref:sulfurtransferase n=1 Tax=Leptolyngbya sp. 7M TaxID=2812896 RepID=UPI001B8CCC8C|nr:sulfurtransferase [Leptolyngbya sp. 7M]QYO66871.1 sulfurtransferase [Leptolyngbya sp. 7M]
MNFIHFKLKRLKMFGVLLVFLIGLIALPALANSSVQAESRATIQFVSPDWVAQHARDSNLRILDVRSNYLEYFTGHIPNAVHIAEGAFRGPNGVLPVQYWTTHHLSQLFAQAGLTRSSQVLVYSDGRDILGATMVAYLLERSGLQKLAVLDGGYKVYKDSGQPVAKEFPQYDIRQFTIRDNPSVRVTLADVRQAIGNSSITFLDPRPPNVFRGEEQIWVRNGHIPGARNIPWTLFTEGDAATNEGNFHALKPLSEIRQLLNDRNIQPTKDIIVTCSTGREATLQYIVLKHLLGYPNVRVYEGSWTEYSSYPDLPVETGPEREA